jgi:hypothetical protein
MKWMGPFSILALILEERQCKFSGSSASTSPQLYNVLRGEMSLYRTQASAPGNCPATKLAAAKTQHGRGSLPWQISGRNESASGLDEARPAT